MATDVGYCAASTVHARATVWVKDQIADGFGNPLGDIVKRLDIYQPNFAISGPATGYLGQLLGYTYLMNAHVSRTTQVQWGCGGNPASGVGDGFATRFFSAGLQTVTASATVKGTGDPAQKTTQWSTQVNDLFCFSNMFGTNEYAISGLGGYPFGVYASEIIDANAKSWKTAFVEVQNGVPVKGVFNPGWLDLYKGYFDNRSCGLANTPYTGVPPDITQKPPFGTAGNGSLLLHNWKGFLPAPSGGTIATQSAYTTLWRDAKDTNQSAINCHGESIHGYLGELGAASWQIKARLELEGVLCDDLANRIIAEYIFLPGDIIFPGDGTFMNCKHSARVIQGGSHTQVTMWAANAGVSSRGTRSGFDTVTLTEWLAEHQNDEGVSQVKIAVLTNIRK